MPSVYDEKAKCRVAEMDRTQFDSECEPENRKFFASFIEAWTKAGGQLKWGAGGVGLRALAGAAGSSAKEVGICFLAPKYAVKQDRIELSCTPLKKQLGDVAVKALHEGLRSAAGDHFKGTTMVSVICPGQLLANSQKDLIATLLATFS